MTSPSMKYEISGNDLQCLELQLSAGDSLIVSLECLNSLDEAIRPESWAIPPSPAGAPDTVAAEAARRRFGVGVCKIRSNPHAVDDFVGVGGVTRSAG